MMLAYRFRPNPMVGSQLEVAGCVFNVFTFSEQPETTILLTDEGHNII